ncbi:tetratricopeptide repeat protein [Caulobacter sp. UNC279MFTsu5.1]|uniref:tetratricopeptide repeat protein n=1 Tax=Caulobacter sp. UNC279MFTsu5.1 TaxID=1502775 RepID=UPI0008ED3B9B|nr:tetratricopeptide repeat protein [Caulobacter sp. UNC279MFTsu5.1]SFJ65900.1 Flp pilus assembly protein TadD, contains TPR repeats [Caulobacter sp. UNC279MFTsu5.1]
MTTRALFAAAAGCILLLAATPGAAAGGWGRAKPAALPAAPPVVDTATREATASAVETALAEGRLVDASSLLGRALASEGRDPRLLTLLGETSLARGDAPAALATFAQVAADAPSSPRARQGEGLALSVLGRSDGALQALRTAVAGDPRLWRAWNGLGREYDRRHDWAAAEDAYAHALDASGRDALALNNRGYSQLLQGRLAEASVDLIAALEKKPDLAAARNNLRLVLALKGDYARASARGAGGDDPAALLNNAGFAALLRGDYDASVALFDQASKARDTYYSKAGENRRLALSLKAQDQRQEASHGN